jgi:ribosomal protein L17
MRILTTQDIDTAAVAARLFEQLPQKLERQTQGYTKMIK